MFDLGPTFIFTAINLLILYFILKRILFKPVTEFMEKRANSIKASIEEAEKKRSEADALKSKYEEHLRAAKEEAGKIIDDARGRAGREYDGIIKQAKEDAEGVLARARDEIDREKERMMADVKNQVAGLAIVIASKIMQSDMDNDKNKVLAEKFINEEGAV